MNKKIVFAHFGISHSINELLVHYLNNIELKNNKNHSSTIVHSIAELKNLTGHVIVIYSITSDEDVLENITQIKSTLPDAKIIVYSNLTDIEYIYLLFKKGINAHVCVSDKITQLNTSIEWILENKIFHSISTHELITKSFVDSRGQIIIATNEPLTELDFKIFKYVLNGFTSKEIADKVSLSKHTIDNHRKSIYGKIGTNIISEMMVWARKNNFDFSDID